MCDAEHSARLLHLLHLGSPEGNASAGGAEGAVVAEGLNYNVIWSAAMLLSATLKVAMMVDMSKGMPVFKD
jgi:hypothetical protein